MKDFEKNNAIEMEVPMAAIMAGIADPNHSPNFPLQRETAKIPSKKPNEEIIKIDGRLGITGFSILVSRYYGDNMPDGAYLGKIQNNSTYMEIAFTVFCLFSCMDAKRKEIAKSVEGELTQRQTILDSMCAAATRGTSERHLIMSGI